MRYGWLLCLLVLALPTLAVEYGLGPAIALTVNASSTKVGPGEMVRLSISASDIDYEMGPNLSVLRQFNDPVTLSWEATGGSFQKMSIGNNPVELNWQAPIASGYYMLTISAADSGRFADDPSVRYMIPVTVSRAGETPTATVRVSVNPPTLNVDRKHRVATITAQLLGDNNLAGKTVRFYATRGTLSAVTDTTDANGAAVVKLTVDQDMLGAITVAAVYANTTSTATIIVVDDNQIPLPYPDPTLPPGPNPSDFGATVDPNSIPADGKSSAIVTVRLTDSRGYGMPRQPVSFRSTLGIVNPAVVATDYYGYAHTRVYAPTTPGAGTIIAESYGKRSYTIITFSPLDQQPAGAQTRLYLTVDPTALLADGTSKVHVEALALDQDGHAIPDTQVTFSTTLGTLQQNQVMTDAGGKATTTLTASDRPGQATVTARIGQVSAASQLTFQGAAADGPGLDLRIWSGQQTTYVAERWLMRTVQVENGTQGGFSKNLLITDDAAKVLKEIPLGRNSILIRDQFGAAHGYGIEEDGKARLIILKADGTELRSATIPLAAGSHLLDAQYAEPAGNVLIASAKPDGTLPDVQFLSRELTPVRVLHDGLEAMPVMVLGGDGYLVMALSGGTTRLYAPDGQPVSEARHGDGLTATTVTLAAGGEWYAVATAPTGQTSGKPKLRIYSRQGTELVTFDYDALRLLPINGNALFAATTDRSVYISIPDHKVLWALIGGYERALPVGDTLVIVGLRDPKDNSVLIPRVLVLHQADGSALATQNLNEIDVVQAILPPDDKGMLGVVTMPYTFRFPLPKK